MLSRQTTESNMTMRPIDENTLIGLIEAAMHDGDWQAVEEFGRRLDLMAPSPQTYPILVTALRYSAAGLHIFPLRAGGKQPLPRSKGCLDATTDAGQIREWWARTPDANLAIATGYLVDVIDIDGPLGVLSWSKLVPCPETGFAGDLAPVIGTVSTPRAGGTHLYVTATGDPNSANLWPGIDYRGLGGYVVAPPSIGPGGVAYTWRRPLALHSPAVAA